MLAMKDGHPISDVPYRVHTHDRVGFRQCRRRWVFSSNMLGCMGLESKTWNKHFWLGTGFHLAMELYYRDGAIPSEVFAKYADDWEAKNAEMIDEWDADTKAVYLETRHLGYGICDHYVYFAEEQDPIDFLDMDNKGFEVIETEQEFSVPVRDEDGEILLVLVLDEDGVWRWHPVYYEGRFDGIIRDKFGLLWILEHKTAGQLNDLKLANDDQVGSYIWAARDIYGYDLAGSLYNVAMKKTPIIPPPLSKKPALSQSENVLKGTTTRLYLAAIEDHGYNVEDYAESLATLKEYGWHYFFRRRWIKRSAAEISEIGLRIAWEVREMASPTMVPYPNPNGMVCPWCPFRAVCLQLSDGADWEDTLAQNFQKRTSTDVDFLEEYPV